MAPRIKKPHPYPGIGAKIREARLAAGLSGQALCDLIGASNKQLISLWEREVNCPSEPKMAELERVLGITLPRATRSGSGRRAQRTGTCPVCTKDFPVYYGERYCSRACAAVAKSEIMKGRNSKGGRFIDSMGYVHLHMPDHPDHVSGGFILEHRVVMERKIGRRLHKGENVHHKNGDRADNRPENLELWSTSQPSGQRVVDLIDNALRDPRLNFLTAPKRALVRLALLRRFGIDPDEEPSNPESPRLL